MKSHKPELSAVFEVFDKDGNLKKVYGARGKRGHEDILSLKVKDKYGNVSSHKRVPFRSFHKHFISTLNYGMLAVGNDTAASSPELIKQTDSSDLSNDTENFGLAAAASNTDYGILIGTGTSDPAFADYALGTQLTTNWDYGAVTTTAKTESGTGTNYNRVEVKRQFTNNTGSSVDVKEIALVGKATGGTEHFLIARDNKEGDLGYTPTSPDSLEAMSITVPDGKILEITYAFYITDADYGEGFTSNMVSLLTSEFSETGATAKQTTGTSASVDFTGTADKDVKATASDDDFGLLISSSSRAFAVSNYSLVDQHTEADGVSHGAVTVIDMVTSSTSTVSYSQMGMYRDFTNSTGAQITVNDLSLVLEEGAGKEFLLARLLTDGITLENGEVLRATLYIKCPLDEMVEAV